MPSKIRMLEQYGYNSGYPEDKKEVMKVKKFDEELREKYSFEQSPPNEDNIPDVYSGTGFDKKYGVYEVAYDKKKEFTQMDP